MSQPLENLRCYSLLAAGVLLVGGVVIAEDAGQETAIDFGKVWPNENSSTNGDEWLRKNHDQIELLEPRVLILHGNNRTTPTQSEAFALEKVFPAFEEGSRYLGYNDPSSKPQLLYELVGVVDLRDESDNDWPASWPVKEGKFVDAGLFSPEFTKAMDFKDPKDSARVLSLCELFERGIVNEVWTHAPRGADGNPLGVYESKARIMVYDANMNPTGKFDECAGNACFDPGPHGQCKVSVRLAELALDRGPGCLTHGTGHGMESLRKAIPYYAAVSARFWNFDLVSRYKLPMDTLSFRCPYYSGDCWAYPNAHSIAHGGKAQVPDFKFSKWGDGCGSVHFPPNGRRHYDYDGVDEVLNTCENYGLKNGVKNRDKAIIYDPEHPKIKEYDKLYGDCGGGWQIYMRQSFPGYGNKATGDNGKPMKSWWPFWYY